MIKWLHTLRDTEKADTTWESEQSWRTYLREWEILHKIFPRVKENCFPANKENPWEAVLSLLDGCPEGSTTTCLSNVWENWGSQATLMEYERWSCLWNGTMVAQNLKHAIWLSHSAKVCPTESNTWACREGWWLPSRCTCRSWSWNHTGPQLHHMHRDTHFAQFHFIF